MRRPLPLIALGALLLATGCGQGTGGAAPDAATAGNDSASAAPDGSDGAAGPDASAPFADAADSVADAARASDSADTADTATSDASHSGDTATDSGAGEPDAAGCSTNETPTWIEAVSPIVHTRCGLCHGEAPLGGAPMPLATWEDTQAKAPFHDAQVWERMAERVAAGTMPPPGQPPLSEAEKAELLAWAEGCAPRGEGEEHHHGSPQRRFPVGPVPEGAEPLELRANDYAVPLDKDTYWCFPVDISLTAPKHVVRFDFDVDQAKVVHHIVVFTDRDKEKPDQPYPCKSMPANMEFNYAWAPGGQPLQFPDGYGLPVEDGQRLVLQIHYNNAAKHEGLVDDSGAILYLTDPQPKEVGLFAPGPVAFSVEPGATKVVASGCSITEDIQVFASMPHMHEIGHSFLQTVERADGSVETVVEVPTWDFNTQPFWSTPLMLGPGDRLVTACTFENPHQFTVFSGEGTSDEMCFNFMYHSPPMPQRFCDEPLASGLTAFTQGECAVAGAPSDVPIVTGKIEVIVDTPQVVGTLPSGSYVLSELSFLLKNTSTPAGEVDVDASVFLAAATLVASEDALALDLMLDGTLAASGGVSLPFAGRTSESGTPSLQGEDGKLTLTSPTCQKSDLELVSANLAQDGDDLAGLLRLKIPTYGFTITLLTRWTKAQ